LVRSGCVALGDRRIIRALEGAGLREKAFSLNGDQLGQLPLGLL
jgi:hypothetical protein